MIPMDLTLIGKIVTLRPPTPNDDERLLEIFLDEKTMEHLSTIRPKEGWNERTIQEYIAVRRKQQEKGSAIHCSVELNATKELIGVAGCRHINRENGYANLGAIIACEYWGRGIAAEAGLLLGEYLYETTDIDRIDFQMLADNIRSTTLCDHLGFKSEGIQRNEDVPEICGVDLATFSVTREQIQEVKEKLLARIKKQCGGK